MRNTVEGCCHGSNFFVPSFVTTTDYFSYLLHLLLTSVLFLFSSSRTKGFILLNFTSNRALGLLEEGFANWTQQGTRRRGATPRILFKPLQRLLLSGMMLPSLNCLLFLRRRQDRIANSQTRGNGWRLRPRSKEGWTWRDNSGTHQDTNRYDVLRRRFWNPIR